MEDGFYFGILSICRILNVEQFISVENECKKLLVMKVESVRAFEHNSNAILYRWKGSDGLIVSEGDRS